METVSLFDVFKGFKSKKGHVRKDRSVGHVYYDETTGLCKIHIDALERSPYTLEPEIDIHQKHDYLIYYEDLSKKGLQIVGLGYLLHGPNTGLVKLKWDFYYTPNIYVDLSSHQILEMAKVCKSKKTNPLPVDDPIDIHETIRRAI